LAEGFGWPLIEAAACGCPALTTDEPPMNEIAGPRTVYLPRLHRDESLHAWAARAAEALNVLLAKAAAEGAEEAEQAAQWTRRFDGARTIDRYLEIYRAIINRPPEEATHRGLTGSTLENTRTDETL
jgi:glycosyltransferase involved in cell wall biosynthesis